MSRSSQLLAEAREVIPGGVNSPVRSFSAVLDDPPFIRSGQGAWITDEDGRRYVDLVGSWGPLLLGHRPPAVEAALREVLERGWTFGAPTEAEVRFAEDIVALVPSIEQVRLCSSGTEATMHALRLARGYTRRPAIVKLDGCYHGAHDAVLVAAGSGVATYARPGSPGIAMGPTLTAAFNHLGEVEAHLQGGQVAAVIVEPVPGNMGTILPEPGYLEGLRELCTRHGTLLVFDEVMTGFRLALGGAQERFGVLPDLTCLGKIVGGGLPLAAFGGRAEIMQQLSPVGPVYQAGTLSGNPLAVAAGRAMLAELRQPGFYDRLEQTSLAVDRAIRPALEAAGATLVRAGSMMTAFFHDRAPRDFAEVYRCDFERFARFHRACLRGGLYLPCSQFEAWFLNTALGPAEIELIGGVVAESVQA